MQPGESQQPLKRKAMKTRYGRFAALMLCVIINVSVRTQTYSARVTGENGTPLNAADVVAFLNTTDNYIAFLI
jgi:hypothetical protein